MEEEEEEEEYFTFAYILCDNAEKYKNAILPYQSGDYDTAIYALREHLENAKKSENQREKLGLYLYLSKTHFQFNDFKKGIDYSQKALRLATTLKDLRGIYHASLHLGKSLDELDSKHREQAMTHVENALKIAEILHR